MRKGHLRTRLRSLRHLAQRARQPQSRRRLNDPPRAPPIAPSERISDASSALTDVTLDEKVSGSETSRLSHLSRDATCLICLEDLPAGSLSTRLPCRHAAWHPTCVATWLRTAPRCPLCNEQVSAKQPCYRERYHNAELAWTLYDRRMPEMHLPARRRDVGSSLRQATPTNTQTQISNYTWSLHDRRLSSAARPPRQDHRRFVRSFSLTQH